MNKIKFATTLKKKGSKYLPTDKEILITRADFEVIKELFKDNLGCEISGIKVYLGDEIK